MERIVYNNLFHVVDTKTNQALAINVIMDSRGIERMSPKFKRLNEAVAARNLWALATGTPVERYRIESYPDNDRRVITMQSTDPDIIEATRKVGEQMRLFSGKGLKDNSRIPPREERKYNPNGFYGREVWMYQSTERSKGLSLINKIKDKSKKSLPDTHTFQRIQTLTNDGTFSLSEGIVASLLKRKWANRKEIKDYLKNTNSYSCKQINRIVSQYYATLNQK